MKLGKVKCFFNDDYLGEGDLSIIEDIPKNPFTKLERVFESLSDDKIEEIKKQGIPIGVFSSDKSCIVNNISEKKYIKIKKVKHSLNKQSFKFPIINPGYIRVKKEYNLLKTKFGKECIKNAAQNLSDSIDNYLLEMFKTGNYPYIDKRKDYFNHNQLINDAVKLDIVENTMTEMSKITMNDVEDEKDNEAYLCGMTRGEYDYQLNKLKENGGSFKTNYLKKCRDLKKGKKQKEIDFAKLHEQRAGKLFPDNIIDDFQNAFESIAKTMKDFSTFSPIKDIANIDSKIIKSGSYKVDRNRRKINKKKRYKRRKR